ncbi:YqgQ family protein [Tumebacillus lipolyticus]|uniref:YqgQ family protein n=1 Tax=Tumebacillus lipolyticus TaxID=1280370 RepID=A0ABW5A186_9BACL
MNLNTHQELMKVREYLKRFAIIVYTGSPLDDIVMMDLELDDLYEGKHLESAEFQKYKLALRRAYLEAGGEKLR